jgi:hypothetical protein
MPLNLKVPNSDRKQFRRRKTKNRIKTRVLNQKNEKI